MIKIRLSLLLSCLIFSQLLYASTEIKPPSGPFISMLRSTFSKVTSNVKLIEKSVTDEIEYHFEVPDLGRYSEKHNKKPEEFEFLDIKTLPNKLSNYSQTQRRKPAFQSNAFDRLPIEKKGDVTSVSPYELPNRKLPLGNKKPLSHSFDELPIMVQQRDESVFYPPEWAQPNPLRGYNRVPQNNANKSFNQNNSMMQVPVPMQMLPWTSGNQMNNGYHK